MANFFYSVAFTSSTVYYAEIMNEKKLGNQRRMNVLYECDGIKINQKSGIRPQNLYKKVLFLYALRRDATMQCHDVTGTLLHSTLSSKKFVMLNFEVFSHILQSWIATRVVMKSSQTEISQIIVCTVQFHQYFYYRRTKRAKSALFYNFSKCVITLLFSLILKNRGL
jgi:hypothetical protein